MGVLDLNIRAIDAGRLCIPQNATIREAMVAIEEGEEGMVFLTDTDARLAKIITDGDIRRALLGGKGMTDPVADIHQRAPIVVREGQAPDEVRRMLSRRIQMVPVVDNGGRVVGLARLHDLMPFIDIKSREVLVVGLGYVGLTLALVLADNGFSVKGFDTNARLIADLLAKRPPFFEKGLQNYLDAHVGHTFRPVSKLEVGADIYVITVGTPIRKPALVPDIDHIRAAVRSIGGLLKRNDLVVLRSTVPLGCTRNVVKPLLEELSGLKAGEDFFLAFCPERTAEGRALEELLSLPQIIGGICPKSTELAARLFNENTHTVIDVGQPESAEMCKLMDNTFRDTIFAYSNQMAMLCERAGLNFNDLVEKVNLGYGRNAIPKPSPGVGGPCLSKDPYILATNFREYGLEATVTLAARQVNEVAPRHIFTRSQELLATVGKDLRNSKVLIVGFAFKGEPQTSDLRDSTTLWFLDELKREGVTDIWGYDPKVTHEDLAALGVKPCSVEEGIAGADAVFVMNNHRSYAEWPVFELLESAAQPVLFYDGWQVFRAVDLRNRPGVLYAATGVG